MSGLNDNLTVWEKVHDRLESYTRAISYDRGGVGWSDHGANPRDGAMIVNELDIFLDTLNVDPPYVLCAHSFAGLFARLYGYTHWRDVVGIILIDTTHEDRWDRQAAELDPNTYQMIENVDLLTENIMAGYGSRGEWQNRNNTSRKVRAKRWLPDIPLILLSEDWSEYDYLAADQQDKTYELEREMDEDQAALVPRGEWREVPGVGHTIHEQKPGVVAAAIKEVVETAVADAAAE